jgi:thioredoxin-like negative regulator of GroEL
MYEKYADFMKCDVSSEISEKFEVMKIPTFLVLKKDIVVKQFIGSDGETRIQQGLNDTFVKIVIDNDF